MADPDARPRRRSSSGASKISAVELAGLCPCCRGTGLRPTTGVWVALDVHGTSIGMQLTSLRAWSPWTKRSLLVFVVSASVAAGLPTSILDRLVGL